MAQQGVTSWLPAESPGQSVQYVLLVGGGTTLTRHAKMESRTL